ncbi:hypothetical protein [Xanthomonas melonis]|uniref:hypothetical protein n=1 Tax=Xanthomonas melonis TaxID=56456 RepID=UPI0011B084B8|nr:hypothetical protein [Xanthomonas melonis]MCC4602108.1 hypothetical protein [Xanthomonas melonis]
MTGALAGRRPPWHRSVCARLLWRNAARDPSAGIYTRTITVDVDTWLASALPDAKAALAARKRVVMVVPIGADVAAPVTSAEAHAKKNATVSGGVAVAS